MGVEPRVELDDDAAEEAKVLRELILAVEAYRSAASRRLGLNSTESQALSYLLARGPLGQNQLAQLLGITTGSVTPLVDRLVTRGLVSRTNHPADRRRNLVALTLEADRGLALMTALLAKSIPAATTAAERQGLMTLLRALTDELRATASTHAASPPVPR